MKSLQNIKRVVFYGCSFTVGAELADCDIFPELSKSEIDKLKLKERYSVYNRITVKHRDSLDNQKSWSRWCADELNLPWVNRAENGSSMSQIIFSVERDLINGVIEDTDLIIVGITSPERICTFNQFGAQSLIFNNADTRWSNESFRNDFLKEIASDDYILYNWFKDIKYLDMLSDRLQNRLFQQWVWATSAEIFELHTDGVPFYNLSEYMTILANSSIRFDSIIDNNYSFTKLNAWEPENREVFYHPKLELHQTFGKHVAQKFNEQINRT
jgi:hypothetical protein